MGSFQSQTNKTYENLQMCKCLEQIIFELNDDNILETVEATLKYFDQENSYSFNLIICSITYSYFVKKGFCDICFEYLKTLEIKENEIYSNLNDKIRNIFVTFLEKKYNTQESNYLYEKLLQNKTISINPEILKNKRTPYFSHYISEGKYNGNYKSFYDNIKELKKNDWELHKKYINEGHNPNELAKIIRNDEIEKLQEMSSLKNFDFDQIIKPSLYERCSFINTQNVSLIDYAAFFGSVKCFKYLIMNNAKVENTGKYAVAGGNEEIIHLCEQNHSSFKGSYEAAIIFHQNDIFKYLYENNIENFNNLKKLGKKCIEFFAYEIFSFLLEEGMEINKNIINESAKRGNLFLVQNFLEYNKIPDDFLFYALESYNLELVNFIIRQNGYDINEKNKIGLTPLIWASWHNRVEIVKILLDQKGIDVNAKAYQNGCTALIYASCNGNIEIVKLLLEQKRIDVNAKNWDGETALILASRNGHTEIVKLLLEQKGIVINAKDKWFGKTALIHAYENGHTEIVKLLLEQEGIDINAKDDDGKTALMWASTYHKIKIVKLLLGQKGIDVNASDKWNGNTAFMMASWNGHTEIVKLLLEQKGIDINAKDDDGWTALMKASWNGHTEIVKLLLEQKGIDINAKDNSGKTALMKASEKGHTEIVKLLLEQKGIDINAKDENEYKEIMRASNKQK